MRIIIVTGTPGSGKTTYAKRLAKDRGYQYVNVTQIIKQEIPSRTYNRSLRTYEVDIPILIKNLKKRISIAKRGGEKGMIIDSHLSHYMNPGDVNECIVVVCEDRKKLVRRLKKRGYSQKKIDENLQAEIMETCFMEAKEKGHNIKVVKN